MFGFGRKQKSLTTAEVGLILASVIQSTASDEHREARVRGRELGHSEVVETREFCLLHAFAIDFAIVSAVKNLPLRESLRDHFYVEANGLMSWLTQPEMFYDLFIDRAARYGRASASTGNPPWEVGRVFSEAVTGNGIRADLAIGAATFYVESKQNAVELIHTILKNPIAIVKVGV